MTDSGSRNTLYSRHLDLRCPIPWRNDAAISREDHLSELSPELLASSKGFPGSPTHSRGDIVALGPYSTRNCYGSQDISASQDIPAPQDVSERFVQTWLFRRYIETLWLGEYHSPLLGFLHHTEDIKQQIDTECILSALKTLVRSRAHIRCRFRQGEGLSSRAYLLSVLKGREDQRVDSLESTCIRHALSSGPAAVVYADLCSKSADSPLGRISEIWLDAIETRE